jgi:hypothetical protein
VLLHQACQRRPELAFFVLRHRSRDNGSDRLPPPAGVPSPEELSLFGSGASSRTVRRNALSHGICCIAQENLRRLAGAVMAHLLSQAAI